ncbi:MAG TPA: hypothetical protein VIT90_07155 [Lysobacter sp.]
MTARISYRLSLAHNWTTQSNGAQFGTVYFTRTSGQWTPPAVAVVR